MKFWIAVLSCMGAWAAEYLERRFDTKLVPTPLEYAVLVPEGRSDTPLPLLLALHGGNGSRDYLKTLRPILEDLWRAGSLPPMVVATPSAARSLYMDYQNGSQKWETLLTTEFLDRLRRDFNLRRDRKGTLLFGISMGGLGALRLAFKHPALFGGLAALEPGIDPALEWKDVLPRHRFWRSDAFLEAVYGKPFDAALWKANNPASIVAANPVRIRGADLAIYLECGDEDAFGLDEAAEFLHRLLSDHRIKHEYHLVRGADHVGRTIRSRSVEAFEFLGRGLNPPGPDPAAEALRKTLEPLRRRAR